MKMKVAWSKTLEMKQREDKFQESDQSHRSHYQEYRGAIKKVKRYRSAFTTEQVHCLEKEFRKHPYIGSLRRKDVASVLNIPERAVKIWFQNRRMKEKKDTITKETADSQIQGQTDGTNELLNKSASVTNGLSLPVLRINEVKQDDNEVASDLRIKKPSSVLTRIDKDETLMEFLKPNDSTPNISTLSSTKTLSEIAFFSRNNNQCNVKIKSESKNAQVLQVPSEPHPSPIIKNQFHLVSSSSKLIQPQDLPDNAFEKSSHKQVQDLNAEKNAQSGLNINIPLYLKGYYGQPYIPPGHMTWKPINVAPIMSTGFPAVTTATANSSSQQPCVSRSCTCDCHLKQYSNPMVLQQSVSTPVQYVITAVPVQNHTPKF